MQDVIWVGLTVMFYLLSAWFVGFIDRFMPAMRRAEWEDAAVAARSGKTPTVASRPASGGR